MCVNAVFGELGFGSYFSINWWSLKSLLSCACISLMHIWALDCNWANMLLRSQCTSVTWSWVAQCIASSADVVLWEESLSHWRQKQQVSHSCACIDVQHIWALYFSSGHTGHAACVESDEAVIAELESAIFNINWWCPMNIPSCACSAGVHV